MCFELGICLCLEVGMLVRTVGAVGKGELFDRSAAAAAVAVIVAVMFVRMDSYRLEMG